MGAHTRSGASSRAELNSLGQQQRRPQSACVFPPAQTGNKLVGTPIEVARRMARVRHMWNGASNGKGKASNGKGAKDVKW